MKAAKWKPLEINTHWQRERGRELEGEEGRQTIKIKFIYELKRGDHFAGEAAVVA